MNILSPVNLAQLVETMYNIYRDRGSNSGHPTSLHLKYMRNDFCTTILKELL